MNFLNRILAAASAAIFIAGSALAQNAGTVTNHAFVIGKGAGTTGYTSLLCGSAQLAVGQAAADPICRTITGDVTITAAGATAIGATKVTSAMLNADVFSTAHTWAGQQTFVAPILGTPASGTLTNATGLPISTGVSGLGAGCATFLGTPSSANLRGCLTDEAGTGAAYFVGGALGTPASGTATNLTGLPLSGLAAQGAYTFVGNNTGSSAVPTAVDIAGLTTKASPAASDYAIISDQAASGAWKKVTVSSLASAGSVSSLGGLTGALTLPIGQARLTKSGSNLILLPVNGNLMTVNGVTCTVPDAGVTLAPTSLSVGTLYYIYATCSAGAINALEASTTGHSTSTTAGNKGTEIKTGDDARTLVGMARIITGPAWQDAANQRFVVSWFNRSPIDLTNNFTTTRTNATAVGAGPTPTLSEVNTEIRIEFLCWATDAVSLSVSGSFFNSGANTNIASLGVDSTSVGEDVFAVMTGTSAQPLALTHVKKYSEGYHFATILNGVSGGTASYYVFGNAAGGRTTLKGQVNG